MRAEDVLRRVAIGCAIFLLFGPLGGRTMWVGGHTTSTDAGVYNVVALLCGVVALAALAFALWMRERQMRALLALGALVAVAAFGLTAYVSGVYVWARMHGQERDGLPGLGTALLHARRPHRGRQRAGPRGQLDAIAQR